MFLEKTNLWCKYDLFSSSLSYFLTSPKFDTFLFELSVVYKPDSRIKVEPLVISIILWRVMLLYTTYLVPFLSTLFHSGLVNRFLSWKVWIPLGRLTFGAYLVHPILIYASVSDSKNMYHYSYATFVSIFTAVAFNNTRQLLNWY